MLFGLGKSRDNAVQGRKVGGHRFGTSARLRVVPGKIHKLFHGVAIRPRDDNCCTAVHNLGDARFLSAEAPLLPLTDCTNPSGCRCVYEHFDERRGSLRRESDIGLPAQAHPVERRAGLGRRSTDG